MKERLTIFTTLLLIPSLAMAEGAHAHTPQYSDFIPFWINFVIFVLLFYYLVRKPFNTHWVKRRRKFEEGVQGARTELHTAEAKLADFRSKLSSMDTQLAAFKQKVEVEGAHEREEIWSAARDRAVKIKRRAEDAARTEARSAELALQRELADLTVKLAEEKLLRRMSPEGDRKLRERALGNLKQIVH